MSVENERHNRIAGEIIGQIMHEVDGSIPEALVIVESVLLGSMLLAQGGTEYLDVLTERVAGRLRMINGTPARED